MSELAELDLLRAVTLLERGRPDLAEGMLRAAAGADPSDPFAHTVLALLLADVDRYCEAEDAARRAIALDPELGMAYGALAQALAGRRRFRRAETATQEAIRLDPDDEDNHVLLAACRLARGDWAGARESAEEALRLAPDSATAHGLIASASAMTAADPASWQAAAAAALAADPGSSGAHTLTALAQLTRGHETRAVDGFEEALRLDPENEAAQAGLAAALKAAHPLFRPIFRFYMWQERLSRRRRAALIVVPLVTVHALRPLAGNPFVLGLLVAWFAFVLLTWVAEPVANLALRLSPRGRAVLPVEQRRSSSLFGVLVGAGLIALVLCVVSWAFLGVAFAIGFLALSVGSGHVLAPARQNALGIVVGAAALAAFAGAALVVAGVTEPGAILIVVAMLTGAALTWVVRLAPRG
jgi:Tfp pilus assembly protein PilF